MKIYISGKIGEEVISDATRRKFARAEEMLKAKGYEVINPASQKWQDLLRCSMLFEERKGHYVGDSYSFALVTDLLSIWEDCDAVYFLKDWMLSPGANAEYDFAWAIKKRMLFAKRDDACIYLFCRMCREAEAGGKTISTDRTLINKAKEAYCEAHLHEAWLPIEEGKEAEP